MTTPPLLGVLGRMAQMLHGSRHVIWEMDLYPDVAVELGVLRRGSLLERLIGALADWPRRHADAILVLGPCMKERLIQRGIPAERIVIAENWADGKAIRPQAFRRDGRLKLLYSGNLGLAHEFDTVVGAMEQVPEGERFVFEFSGSGPRKSELEAACRRLRFVDDGGVERGVSSEGGEAADSPLCLRRDTAVNPRKRVLCSQETVERQPGVSITGRAGQSPQRVRVVFGAFQPRERLGEMLAGCDIGLVTQRAETCGAVVPSKVYGILAAGRPVLYVGPAKATPARMIAETGCGWHVANGDAAGLAALLDTLAGHFELVEEAGRRARRVFDERYDVKLGTERVLRAIGAVKETARVGSAGGRAMDPETNGNG